MVAAFIYLFMMAPLQCLSGQFHQALPERELLQVMLVTIVPLSEYSLLILLSPFL